MEEHNVICKELPLGKQLNILAKAYIGELRKSLGHLEIERYFAVLLLIQKSGNECTQQFVSDVLDTDKAAMVRIIDYLVEKDFLKRVVNPSDRRAYWVRLTPKALKHMPEIQQAVSELNERALKGFTKSERDNFYRQLELIHQNLH